MESGISVMTDSKEIEDKGYVYFQVNKVKGMREGSVGFAHSFNKYLELLMFQALYKGFGR